LKFANNRLIFANSKSLFKIEWKKESHPPKIQEMCPGLIKIQSQKVKELTYDRSKK
jgi:hypothetical protein